MSTPGATISQVLLPPQGPLTAEGLKAGGWWHSEGERTVCDLCPRRCSLHDGDRGFCFVRENVGGRMMLSTYGRSTGFCIDPIEKKPLNHFHPGTSVLSFGTAGCNLGCKFCQNWSISKSREVERLSQRAMPEDVAEVASSLGCRSVAFTYNDPVIWAEYAIDTAAACRERGVKAVAVTAGYITPEARPAFFKYMDAANVDLKAFSERFYHRVTLSHLEPVLETLRWLKHETDVWFELTNLVIPGENDEQDEFRRMADWILENLGDDTPIHFTAFHPDYRLQDRPPTPPATLIAARETALSAGLKYAYVGNVNDAQRQSTWCPSCGSLLIERNWYNLGKYTLAGDCCAACGTKVPGCFDAAPGEWGARREPVNMQAELKRLGRHVNQQVIAETQADDALELSADQQAAVLAATRQLVDATVGGGTSLTLEDPQLAGAANLPVAGVFVSLYRSGRLRGCCGQLGQPVPLLESLKNAAVRSAKEDPRFPRVSPIEPPYLDLDVWLLSTPERVPAHGAERVQAVTVGKHGVQVMRGESRGLLLPSVAEDHGWNAEELLAQSCIKAGLPPSAWRDDETTLLTFEGLKLSAPATGETPRIAPQRLLTDEQLRGYAEFCRSNLKALMLGATPSYYQAGLPDANVQGVVLSLGLAGSAAEQTVARLAINKFLPLQATLFELCKNLSQSLVRRVRPEVLDRCNVDAAILTDTAIHGVCAASDLRGLEETDRALLVSDGRATACLFRRGESVEQVLEETARRGEMTGSSAAQVYSLQVQTLAAELGFASVPRAVRGPEERLPAVAGTFYPGQPHQIQAALKRLLPADGQLKQQAWPAGMVPHAAWQFSAHIAADVLRRIAIPETVIVIGPRHTPHGMRWAVAPQRTWKLPGLDVPSDMNLSRRLAAGISGLELDAAAHRQEHGIEVQLPLIAHLAPQTKVVGLTISGGSLEECRRFGRELAAVIRTLPQQPLLLISSDMNHFATDAENRRLDELALAALETLDTEKLYTTCTQNHISMCGMLPAVIVIEALRELGQLNQAQRVAYATSADASGDKSRVVGYAGVLFS